MTHIGVHDYAHSLVTGSPSHDRCIRMSLFEKLKTAVLGNPVLKEYELGKHVCSAGPGLLWRVHDGVKKTTRQVRTVYLMPLNCVDGQYNMI